MDPLFPRSRIEVMSKTYVPKIEKIEGFLIFFIRLILGNAFASSLDAKREGKIEGKIT